MAEGVALDRGSFMASDMSPAPAISEEQRAATAKRRGAVDLLLAPADAVLGRLRTPQRLALVALVCAGVVAACWYMVGGELARTAMLVQTERLAHQYRHALVVLTGRLHHYEALLAAGDDPDRFLKDAVAAEREQIDALMATIGRLDTQVAPTLTTTPRWQAITRAWESAKAGSGPAGARRGRALDPALDEGVEALTAYLRDAPALAEAGVLQTARGIEMLLMAIGRATDEISEAKTVLAGAAVRGVLTADERARLTRLTASVRSAAERFDRNAQGLLQENPALRDQIGGLVLDFFIAAHRFLDVVEQQVLKRGKVSPATAHATAAGAVDAALRLRDAPSVLADGAPSRPDTPASP